MNRKNRANPKAGSLPAAALTAGFLLLSACSQKPVDLVPRPMGYVTYAIRDIKKGEVVKKSDIESKKIVQTMIPGDNCDASEAEGKTAVEDIGRGQVVSVLDLGLPLSKQAIAKMEIEDYSTSPEIKYDLVCATKDLEKGHSLTASDVTTAQVPSYMIPQDALEKPEQAVGKKCKFAVAKGQIVMQHYLLAN
jgi:flagella basal body P-ring formation protein FlgA